MTWLGLDLALYANDGGDLLYGERIWAARGS